MYRIYQTKKLIFLATFMLVLAGIWVALLLECRHDRIQTRRAAEVDAANLALACAEQVKLTVHHVDGLVLELRDEYRNGRQGFLERIRFHQKQQYNQLIIQVSVIDPRGQLVYNSQGLPPSPTDLSDREHFRVHLATPEDRLFISKPIIGRVSKKWSIQFTRKVFNKDGSFGGVLVVSIDPDYFSGFFRNFKLGKDGTIMLAGMDRVIRASSAAMPRGEEPKGMRFPADRPYFDSSRPAADVVDIARGLRGNARIVSYRRLKEYPLVVLVSQARDEVLAQSALRTESLVWKAVLVSLALLAAYGLVSWFDRKQQILNERLMASEERYRLLNRSLENRVEEEIAKNNAAQQVVLQQEKLASLGQLAAGVAHEINNPVSFITSNLHTLKGYLSTLDRFLARVRKLAAGSGPAVQQELARTEHELDIQYILSDGVESVDESLDGAGRVSKIVADLVGFSRTDGSDFAPADVNACLDRALSITNNELKHVASVVTELGTLPAVYCNAQQLTQVFINLLINASQAIEGMGVVTVKSRLEGEQVLVEISDTGCGVDPALQSRIFEPFFTTKEVGKGTGLGLSIAYDIARKHGGDLWVESVVGKGSTFTLSIPCRSPLGRDGDGTPGADGGPATVVPGRPL
ncbi:MAG TPA: ATP-binding protein [Geomonas sp.]|nr:ATP-binding protein [Geomonas sp.]